MAGTLVSALHVHVVFVTKYRRGVPDAEMLRCYQDAMRKVCGLQRCPAEHHPALHRAAKTPGQRNFRLTPP